MLTKDRVPRKPHVCTEPRQDLMRSHLTTSAPFLLPSYADPLLCPFSFSSCELTVFHFEAIGASAARPMIHSYTDQITLAHYRPTLALFRSFATSLLRRLE